MRPLRWLDYRLWLASRRPGLLLWALFLLWETLGVRVALGSHVAAAGLLDDAALVLAGMALALALDGVSPWVRLPALGVMGSALTLFSLGCALFYRFFNALPGLGSFHAIDQVPAVSGSLKVLLQGQEIWLHGCVPLGLLAFALWLSAGRARRPDWRWALFAGGSLLAGLLTPLLHHETFLLAENNPVLHLGRQAVHRLYVEHGVDRQGKLNQVAHSLASTFNAPPSDRYQTGTRADYPLFKVPVAGQHAPEKKLNVIVVLMESFRLRESGIGTDHAELAPNLDALAREGLYFDHFYANAHQTVRGELAMLCSLLPNPEGGQVYSVYPELSTTCLPQVLARQGYDTYWLNTFSADYGNKRGFLIHHGIQHVLDQAQASSWPKKKPNIGWGASDEDAADWLVDVLDKSKGPFFAEWMTLSNHHPFPSEFPIPPPPSLEHSEERGIYLNYQKGLHYTDHAVGHLIEVAQSKPWFKDTIFVFLGDHGTWLFPETLSRQLTPTEKIEAFFRVPLIIWSPAHVKPQRSSLVASQIDVAPTVLDLLGLQGSNAFEGVSLLQDVLPEKRFALLGNEGVWSIRQGDDYCYATGQVCFRSMAPYCPSGFDSGQSGHSCFHYGGDLLDLDADRSSLTLLSEANATSLMERGTRIVDDTDTLLTYDAFVPRGLQDP
jgi:phosphoglycerol transferase MdoB-like AlkP superfamily enzyme